MNRAGRLLLGVLAAVFAPASSRMLVGYSITWDECPSDLQLQALTHVVFGFVSTYTGTVHDAEDDPVLPRCTDTCTIKERWCHGVNGMTEMANLAKRNKAIPILSIGGWAHYACWPKCYGKEEWLAQQLVDAHNRHGFAGIDINFEINVHSPEAKFLKELTRAIRRRAPSTILMHTPINHMVFPGAPYLNEFVSEVRDDISYLMVQYYDE